MSEITNYKYVFLSKLLSTEKWIINFHNH